MKYSKYLIYFLFAAVFILFIGCPYNSEVPLSNSTKAKIDEQLLGKWEGNVMDVDTLEFLQFNDNEYIILLKEIGKNECGLMRAFITEIKDQNFLNIQSVYPPNDDKEWIFINFKVKNDALTIKVIEDNIFKKQFTSSDSLYNFTSENLNNIALYGTEDEAIIKRLK